MRSSLINSRACIRLGVFYLVLVGALCWFQDQLIYQAPSDRFGDWSFAAAEPWVTELEFPSEDGVLLTAWYGKSVKPRRGVVLYFHGNGENIASQKHELINFCQSLHFDLMMVDYRGFGKSHGTPSEDGLLMDARASMRKVTEVSGVQAKDVVVFGRSLGGACAAHVASNSGAKCLLLHSTYAAMDELVASKAWFAPMRWLLWNHLPTIQWVRDYDGPVFIAHGQRDTLIPFDHAERLFASSPSHQKTFLRQNATHFDAVNREFYVALHRFLSALDQ